MRAQLLLSIANVTNSSSSMSNGQQLTPQQAATAAAAASTSSSIRLLAGSHMNSTNGNGQVNHQHAQSTAAQSISTSIAAVVQVCALNLNGASPNASTSPQASTNGNHVTTTTTSTTPHLNSLSYYLANPNLINTAALHASSSVSCQSSNTNHSISSQITPIQVK